MKITAFIALVLYSFTSIADDSTFQGTWQGVIIKSGQTIDKGTLVYAEFKLSDGVLSGNMREELFETDNYGLKLINGTQEAGVLKFDQIAVAKKKKTSRTKWCRTFGELTYNKTNGYLTGTFKSTDCKRLMGKIILYFVVQIGINVYCKSF